MSFGDGVARINAKNAKSVETTARKVVFELFRRVIMRTPVDTGAARGNWMVTVGGDGENPVVNPGASDKSGGGALGRAASVATTFPLGATVWISNGLPYIRHLEYGLYPNPPKHPTGKTVGGFSRQAPSGMVRVTAVEFQGIVSRLS